MEKWLEALQTVTFTDSFGGAISALLAGVTALILAIWVLVNWAYGHKEETLKISLEEYKNNFEHRILREKEKLEAQYGEEVKKLGAKVHEQNDKLEKIRADFMKLHEGSSTAYNVWDTLLTNARNNDENMKLLTSMLETDIEGQQAHLHLGVIKTNMESFVRTWEDFNFDIEYSTRSEEEILSGEIGKRRLERLWSLTREFYDGIRRHRSS